jgi:para-nitrobenzyl esterase
MTPNHRGTPDVHARRKFLKKIPLLVGGANAPEFLSLVPKSVHAAIPASNRAAAGKNFVIAETNYGKLRGSIVDGINVFKGIPYGDTTAGKNRFMPPRTPTSWAGVRSALEWGHIAPQPFPSGGPPFPAWKFDYVRLIQWMEQPGGQGEDCLVLNVWTPGIKDGLKRPVLISLHGGGFDMGSGAWPGYSGHQLARYGNVVVVTINHRLGCLGYLHLADLGTPPEYAKSGTVGMLDCVAALQWVQDNIENFGGDSGNVMIFGQSGGGVKVTALLSMPAARGLFHRAAIQSGSALRLTSREAATKSAERLLDQIGLDQSRVTELQEVPFEMMVSAQSSLLAQGLSPRFQPIVDGGLIPHHPFDPVAPEISSDIPIIVSTTLDEEAFNRTDFELDEAGLHSQVRAVAGNAAGRLISAYRDFYPNISPFLLLCRMLSDRGAFRQNAITLAERKAARNGAPVYMYLCAWPSPGCRGKFGAVHGTDLPLVFHNIDLPVTGNGPEARALADKLASAWIAFAKTGNPNTPSLPEWPSYTREKRATMIFDNTCRIEMDPAGELRQLWQETTR